jgi:hypothetical protein
VRTLAGVPRIRTRLCHRVRSGKIEEMKPNRSVPPATVVPVLSYPDLRAAVAWLTAAFGFVERTRIGDSHRRRSDRGAAAGELGGDYHSRLRGGAEDHPGPDCGPGRSPVPLHPAPKGVRSCPR